MDNGKLIVDTQFYLYKNGRSGRGNPAAAAVVRYSIVAAFTRQAARYSDCREEAIQKNVSDCASYRIQVKANQSRQNKTQTAVVNKTKRLDAQYYLLTFYVEFDSIVGDANGRIAIGVGSGIVGSGRIA